MTDNFGDIQAHLNTDSNSNNNNQVNIPPRSGTGSNYNTFGRNSSFAGSIRPPGIRIPSNQNSPSTHNAAGINSLGHFASSYTRAQSFLAIEPPNELSRARSYFVDDDLESSGGPAVPQTAGAGEPGSFSSSNFFPPGSRRPSFSARFFDNESLYSTITSSAAGGAAIDDDNDSEVVSLLPSKYTSNRLRRRSSYLAPPEPGTTLLLQGEAVAPGTETEPVIVRTVEDKDGNVSTEVAGQSTVPQTIFNSVNLLIGIGLLSLPLGFKYSGWLLGFFMLIFSAVSTRHTALLLAKCMDTDPTLVTYADIAYAAYGPKGRLLTSLLFTFELMGMGVSLVILFADSLNALFPEISKDHYKVIAFIVLTPPCFLPLRILSISSILGILSTIGLVFLVLFDGLYKQTAPGSLWQPATTHILPKSWMAVPLSIGIFMAPWGGHAVFPNIYRDMRHPQKYEAALSSVYKITFSVDAAMGILGFLMFGANVENEVTKSILLTKGYPPHQGIVVTSLISLIPLAKTPLNARPIVSTLDTLLGLDKVPLSFAAIFGSKKKNDEDINVYEDDNVDYNEDPEEAKAANNARVKTLFLSISKAFVRVFVVFMFVLMSVVFPDFERIIAFFGASLCVAICVVGPIGFYLKIYNGNISKYDLWINYFLLVVYIIFAIVGTAWCFIPHEKLGI